MTSKSELRQLAYRRRRQQTDRPELSRRIFARVFASQPYLQARKILMYASVQSEVSTLESIVTAIDDSKQVFVPRCSGSLLELFRITDVAELAPGSFGIPEPPLAVRERADRAGHIRDMELAIVPGVAFGRDGSRLGNGRGYFDRLFRENVGTTLRVGIAFECQMFDSLPVEEHDIGMDAVVTEAATYGPHKARLLGTT